MILRDEIQNEYKQIEDNIYSDGSEGYWSNLNKSENAELISALQHISTKEAIKKYEPWLFEVIFSPKRAGGLELLDISGDEICVDYGCMWGALTTALAKRCKYVLGIDQTLDSLKFLKNRIKEEGLENTDLLCGNLKQIKVFENKIDIALVNGVLEWIPEEGPIELKTYWGKYKSKKYSNNPKQQQIDFLKKIHQNLNTNGKLYLAIENRFDFKMFFGVNDPHANILFVSFLPRKIADLISKIRLGRPYRNWIYSFNGIQSLLEKSGFSRVELFMVFPDYRFPDEIIPYNSSLHNFELTISSRNEKGKITIKRFLARIIEFIMFRLLKAKYFAPSIIAIGYK